MNVLLILTSLACKGADGPTAWAMNYGEVVPAETSVEGTHVWEFFAEGWEKKQKDKFYQCALVQSLTGVTEAELDGCEACKAVYEVELSNQDEDCEGPVTDDPAFEGIVAIGIGSVPESLADYDPYPGKSFGWYISFDGETAIEHGYAYAASLDDGDDPALPGWVPGEAYALWPAYAWSL